MAGYAVLDAVGELVRAGICSEAEIPLQAGEGQTSHEIPVECIAVPTLNLTPLRLEIGEKVKAARDHAIDSGAPSPVGPVDSDGPARINISGAALGAAIAKQAGQPFSLTWTLLDNSTATLDADGMMAVGLSVLAHVNACHARARQFRTAIEEAATISELLAIDVTAGWPSLGTED